MTEREMLELAAKAAGINWQNWTKCRYEGEKEFRVWPYDWNPRTDDGDAQRLAVTLGLAVSVDFQVGSTAVLWGPPTGSVREPHNGDPYAATRLAITRAAAEIGKSRGGD